MCETKTGDESGWGKTKRCAGTKAGADALWYYHVFACVLLFYRPRETFSITALDVGQGDALVVESGRF